MISADNIKLFYGKFKVNWSQNTYLFPSKQNSQDLTTWLFYREVQHPDLHCLEQKESHPLPKVIEFMK